MLTNYFSLKMKHYFHIPFMRTHLTAQVKNLMYPSGTHTLHVKELKSTVSNHWLPAFGVTHKILISVHLGN